MTGAPWPPADPPAPAGGPADARIRHAARLHNAEPSWFGIVLAVLERDYPRVSARVWQTAIDETAAQQRTAERGTE